MKRSFVILLGISALSIAILISLRASALAMQLTAPRAQVVNATGNALTAEPYLIAQPDGAAGAAIAFDVVTHQPRFVLTPGIRSADGRRYFSALTHTGSTSVHELALEDGRILNTFALDGEWTLRAVSANGTWLALTRNAAQPSTVKPSDKVQTQVVVLNTAQGNVTHNVSLDGSFEVEAISDGGKALFLIEHAPAEYPNQYLIRVYDLTTNELQPPARVKGASDVMIGEAWDVAGSADGKYLHTLYLDTSKSKAFIHLLDLVNHVPRCIDLPSGNGDLNVLKQYTLALSHDGRKLYAVNPALGVVAIVNPDARELVNVIRFNPVGETAARGRASGFVTSDGARVYFTNGASVWAADVAAGTVTRFFQNDAGILGLGASVDGAKLYTVDSRMQFEEHSASSIRARAKCPVTQPPRPAFVPPAPYPRVPPYGEFWYGTEKLWTLLQPGGRWTDLPEGHNGYVQKTVWWRPGYDGAREQQPALTVSGKQLDGNATFVEKQATNAHHPDFGGWAMMAGIEIPQAGCWEITGEYGGEKLSYVVWVEP